MARIILFVLCFTLALTSCLTYAEKNKPEDVPPPAEEAQKGTFKVDLPNGSYYWCFVPERYDGDGSTGIFLVMHGAGGTADGMLGAFTQSGTNWLDMHNCMGVFPKSKDQSWMDGESTPMDALNDAMKKYKLDKKRVHVAGYSAGGFFSGWLGFEKPELFRTVMIFAAFVSARANMGAVKKNIDKPVYMMCGERDPNANGALADYNNMVKMGSRVVRNHVVPGEEHNFAFQRQFETVFKWFRAMESGFDYAKNLDEAEKHVEKNKVEKAMELVKLIEAQPVEDVFWEHLGRVKNAINEKGEKKLKSTISGLKSKPSECIKKLKEIEELYAGYPVAEKAAAEREKLEQEQGEKE